MPKVGMEPIRRRQVINAALDCIATGGFEGLTLDAVARAAGVSKGVVSYYFRGKEDLIAQSLEAFLDHYNQLVTTAIQDETSALRMLDLVVDLVVMPSGPGIFPADASDTDDCFITLSSDRYFPLLVHYYARIIGNEQLKISYSRFYDQYLEGVMAILEHGRAQGEFVIEDTRETSYAIMSQLDGAILYQALGFRPLGDEQVTASCKRYIRQLLGQGER